MRKGTNSVEETFDSRCLKLVVLVVKRASLVAQRVNHLPTMRETWVRYLGWEDPLEEGMATHSNILAWRIPMDRGVWQARPWGHKE